MTNERACANNDAQSVEPVSHWENEEVHRHALCVEPIFRDHIAKVEALRNRQAAYVASLPTEYPAAVSAVLNIVHPEFESYPDGVEEALHLSFALEAMIKNSGVEGQGRSRDAAVYVAERISDAMHRAVQSLDKITDILQNADKAERGL
ncbi:hypothetical protein BMI91_10370 [Thioclava sediminum]|uniref:Uncharacterized protein n=1 Tax=Thioclava sediminum TaxID=1915319 RepID=A0ABX3MYJ3_9RHOB|nr:hypothetical protein [Thioclava sediminum]OOY24437.1 hypothetical protein BMI91_10370 [Thioclava sediminum]